MHHEWCHAHYVHVLYAHRDRRAHQLDLSMQRVRTDRLWLLSFRDLTLGFIQEAFAMAAVDDSVYCFDRIDWGFVLVLLPRQPRKGTVFDQGRKGQGGNSYSVQPEWY